MIESRETAVAELQDTISELSVTYIETKKEFIKWLEETK